MIRIYIDSLLLLAGSTFALDLVVLWAVRQMGGAAMRASAVEGTGAGVGPRPGRGRGPSQTSRRTTGFMRWRKRGAIHGSMPRSRLAAAAAVSTAAFVGMLGLAQVGLVDLKSGASLTVAALAAIASLILAFPGISARSLATAFFYRCLLSALAGGAGTAAYSVTSGSLTASFVAAIATVAVAAESGWGAVHRGIRDGLFVVPVEIDFGSGSVCMHALIDTGNRLRDPTSGVPAIIVEYGAIESALPQEIRAALTRSDEDFVSRARAIAGSAWSSRFRAVPYSSVGRKRGMMVGFRPDQVRVADGRRMVTTSRAVVCVHTSTLCPGGNYRALINPDILTAA